MSSEHPVLVIGAGISGATMANLIATKLDMKVLVIDRKDHIAGNCYDYRDDNGIMIHKYGSHIFHTSNDDVWRFLRQFTGFNTYMHKVIALIDGIETTIPFNFNTIRDVFPGELADRLESKLLEKFQYNRKIPIMEFGNQDDPDLKFLADYVYEKVFLHYTTKQWGTSPEGVDGAVTARVPVYLSRDDRYFQDAYQGMPLEGYTPMFERMLDHPNITVELGVNALDRLDLSGDVIRVDGAPFRGPVIYTGQADELFGFKYGPLPYRTLDFRFETLERDDFQNGYGTVTYTVDQDYTRITEFKHLTGQQVPGKTTIVKEYSKAYSGVFGEIPYYAIINPENNALYEQYRALGARFGNLYLLGRLAEYKYYNMDAIAARALKLAETLS